MNEISEVRGIRWVNSKDAPQNVWIPTKVHVEHAATLDRSWETSKPIVYVSEGRCQKQLFGDTLIVGRDKDN